MLGRMHRAHWSAIWLLLSALPAPAAEHTPLRLHPDNPHYFLFRGKPTLLVTSGEHYGAVLNADFDYLPYLDELHARGFNLTRTFSGMYREVPGSFGITENTLAPKPERYVCPWPRSATPGAGDGGNKFDLNAWNAAYFARLKDFVAQAGKRGIVVELTLFCTVYDDKLWAVNPMKADNNVQGVGRVSRLEAYTLKDQGLAAVQKALARKLITELRDFDNIYFEVCNEPYFGGVTRAWTDVIVAEAVRAEAGRPARHLLSQNISNNSSRVARPNPHISIFNFHYSNPPDSVAMNAALRKAVADDETGFRGTKDRPYRVEGWKFLTAGGAVYSNLDYSFTCARPNGTAVVTTSPGGGGPELRKQLQIMKQFFEGFDFIHMRPDNSVVVGGTMAVPLAGAVPEVKASVRVLAEPGKAYALYVAGGTQVQVRLALPAGRYHADWVNTRTGKVERAAELDHRGGPATLESPPYQEDIALRLKRREER
jgi:hypothetical protein